jgi:hypothetical protein
MAELLDRRLLRSASARQSAFPAVGTYRWIAERRGLLVTGPCGITEPTTTPATTTAVNGKPPKGAKDEPQTSPIVRPAG